MFWIIFASVVAGILIGIGLCLWRVQPRLRAVQQYDEKTYYENCELEDKKNHLIKEIQDYDQEKFYLEGELLAYSKELESTRHLIHDLKLQAEEAGKTFYDQVMSNMQLELEKSAEQERLKFLEAQQRYEDEYAIVLEQSIEEYNTIISALHNEKTQLEQSLLDARSIVDSAIAANKRAYEIAEETNFYRLNLSESDLEEIEKLRSIMPYLRDPEALNKVIWKIYYEKPYTDLIGRVVGQGVKTGIYKITNTNNQMCYVGQAVNIADRWKQHIKRGIGAEQATKNKLYPAMMKEGVEVFTFEIVEQCDRAQLNDKEDYWQDYFKAKEFGYSIK